MSNCSNEFDLSDDLIAQEEQIMNGIPRFNLGAFILPCLWGPVHGLWAAFLFYPLWIFADNIFYLAYSDTNVWTVIGALAAAAGLFVLSLIFALLGQPLAARRAIEKGIPKDVFLKKQRVWTIVCVSLAIIAVILATYWNIVLRPGI